MRKKKVKDGEGQGEEEQRRERTGIEKPAKLNNAQLHLMEYVIKGRNCIFSGYAYITLILNYIINLYF